MIRATFFSALSFVFLAACVANTAPSPEAAASGEQADTHERLAPARDVIDAVDLNEPPHHAADETDAGCYRNVFCVAGSHWDPSKCTCVVDDDASAPAPDCHDVVLCIKGTHWNQAACSCTPNDP